MTLLQNECGMGEIPQSQSVLTILAYPGSQDAGCLDTPDAVFGSAGFAHRNGMRIKVQNVIGTKSPVQIDLETSAELPDGIDINIRTYIYNIYMFRHTAIVLWLWSW